MVHNKEFTQSSSSYYSFSMPFLIGNTRDGRDGLLGARFIGRRHFLIEDDEE
jgi:hypothetical protein